MIGILIAATLAQFAIIGWSWFAYRRYQARLRIRRRLARLRWLNGHPDPFELATQIDALLWMNRLDTTHFGIASLKELYALVEPAEERYAAWQRTKTSQK